MTNSDAALSQNLEFYRAIAARDLAAMERIWAREAPVSCIHPGWPVVHGRALVLQSWRAILTGPHPPQILCYEEDATVYGDLALVTCEEELDGGSLAASNLFALENGLWRLVHHQATPIMTRRETPGPGKSVH
jgi:ketosteroid isomerase-like protein